MGNLDESWYYTPLKLDCADGYISEPLLASPEDANGRGIDLTLLQDFVPINTSGYHVDLEWQTAHGCGMEPFEEQSGTGRWRVTYPGAMLKPGLAWARIAVYLGESQVITSKRFRVKVEKNVIDLCLAEKDSDFSQFVQATIDLRELDDEMREQAIRYAEAELARQETFEANEIKRQEGENARIAAEQTRASNEEARVEAEEAREEAEETREYNEGIRIDNEKSRIANEQDWMAQIEAYISIFNGFLADVSGVMGSSYYRDEMICIPISWATIDGENATMYVSGEYDEETNTLWLVSSNDSQEETPETPEVPETPATPETDQGGEINE